MSNDIRPIRIAGVPEHFNLPWHMALATDARPPVPAVWKDFPGGTGAMCRALATDEVDVAVLLTEGIVRHIADGGSARIVGTYTATPLVWGVHVAAASRFRTMDELKDARFAISRRGSGSQLMAALDAAQRGWPEPSYQVVGDLAGGRDALTAGEADAFMWEKTMSLPLVHAGEWRRVGEFAGPWPAFVIAASERTLSAGMPWLGALCDHIAAACERAERERAATIRFIGDSYNIPADDIVAWLNETTWNCRPTIDADVLETVLATLSEARLIDDGFVPSDFVDAPDRLR